MVDAKRLDAELIRLDDLLHEARVALKAGETRLSRVLRAHELVEDVEERLFALLIDLEDGQ